jgi:uncharacterized delta-60 repeat protein
MGHFHITKARVFLTVAAVAVGAFAAPPAAAGDVVRLLSNGQLDPSFNGCCGNGGGIVVGTGGPGFSTRVQAFDGKPIIGGYFVASDHQQYGYVSRYNADGSPDSNFGYGGFTVADFAAANKQVHIVDLQSSGQIIAGGLATFSDGTNGFVLWRFNTDGSPDSTFGSGGTAHAFTRDSGIMNAMRVLPDDSILTFGTSAHGSRWAAALFTPNGSLDTTFNGNGTLEITAFTGQGFGVDYDGDNFVLVGKNFNGTIGQMEVVRITNRGVVDPNFGSGGYLQIHFPGFINEAAHAVRCWPQSGCFVAGSADAVKGTSSGPDQMAIAHVTTAGVVDGTFGYKTPSFGSAFPTSQATSIAITNDQKVIVSGWAATSDLRSGGLAVAKYSFAGVVDNSFNGNGKRFLGTNQSFLVGSALDPTTGDLVLCD